jgi:hypothetical protein
LREELGVLTTRIEVVISNNHSTDATDGVLADFSDWELLRVVKPPKHLNGNEHILWVPANGARGDYCWLIGDDDFVLKGGPARILRELDEVPDVDWIFIDIAQAGKSEWLSAKALGRIAMGDWHDKRIVHPCQDVRTNAIADILNREPTGCFGTAMMGLAFRRTLWIEAIADGSRMHCARTAHSTTVANSFPHLAIALQTPARVFSLVAAPCCLQINGQQAWANLGWPRLVASVYPRIFSEHKRLKVSRSHRKALWRNYMRTMTWFIIGDASDRNFRERVGLFCRASKAVRYRALILVIKCVIGAVARARRLVMNCQRRRG